MREIFIDCEPRPFRGELEQNAARLRKVNGLEPETIDHRRRAGAAFLDVPAAFELVRLIVHSPREMMDAASSPSAAARGRAFVKVDVGAGFPSSDAVTMPSVFRPKVGESHRLGEKRTGPDEITLDQAGALQATDLVLLWNRTL